MRRLILYILLGILSLYLSAKFVPGINFVGPVKIFLLAGLSLGIINYFIKPLLSFFLFPLNILTFGIFGLVINIGSLFVVLCYLFKENFYVAGLWPLILATLLTSFIYTFFLYLSKLKYE